MRVLPVLFCAALCMSSVRAAPSGLDGAWVIDLSTSPSKPYTQPMTLVLKPDGSVEGSFYNSPIEGGRWKDDRGRLCASFRTSDGVGPYHSAVCLSGDAAVGQTWAEHRSFLFKWTGTRAAAQVPLAVP